MHIMDQGRNLTLLHSILQKIIKNLTITRPSNIKKRKQLFHILWNFHIRIFEQQHSFSYNLHTWNNMLQKRSPFILTKIILPQLNAFSTDFKFNCRSKIRYFYRYISQNIISIIQFRMFFYVQEF